MPIYRKGDDQFPLAMRAFEQSTERALNNRGHLDRTLANLKKPVSELKDVEIRGSDIAILKDMGKLPKDKPLPSNVTDLADYKLRKKDK